jgi:hypothetical protein
MVTRAAANLPLRGVRQRRWRERQKPPERAVYLVEVERDSTRQALINSSRVSANEINDRDCVARVLSRVIAEWANTSGRYAYERSART